MNDQTFVHGILLDRHQRTNSNCRTISKTSLDPRPSSGAYASSNWSYQIDPTEKHSFNAWQLFDCKKTSQPSLFWILNVSWKYVCKNTSVIHHRHWKPRRSSTFADTTSSLFFFGFSLDDIPAGLLIWIVENEFKFIGAVVNRLHLAAEASVAYLCLWETAPVWDRSNQTSTQRNRTLLLSFFVQ